MLIKNPQFEISAVSPKQYPNNGLPEVVLLGKSNVGKSSFINTMLNRKSLARTSSSPGKTRTINFYNLDQRLYFVDLPGYGYSKMSKQEQAKVGTFIEEYLTKSKNISLTCLLIDIRHNPSQDDKLMYDFLVANNLEFIIITTKADKIAPTKVESYLDNIRKELNAPEKVIILPFSTERKIYTDTVWETIFSD